MFKYIDMQYIFVGNFIYRNRRYYIHLYFVVLEVQEVLPKAGQGQTTATKHQ